MKNIIDSHPSIFEKKNLQLNLKDSNYRFVELLFWIFVKGVLKNHGRCGLESRIFFTMVHVYILLKSK